eukprot:tig00020687_g12980.t1
MLGLLAESRRLAHPHLHFGRKPEPRSDYTASADEGGIALVSSVFKYRWEFQKVATDAAAAAAASVEGSPDELMATIEAAQPTLTVDPKELGLEAGTAYSVTLSLFSARSAWACPRATRRTAPP